MAGRQSKALLPKRKALSRPTGVRPENLTGQTFGQLTALRLLDRKSGGKRVWLCKCTCGGYAEVAITHLKTGHTKTCGCNKRRYPAAFKIVLGHYVYGAKRRGYEWRLTNTQAIRLLTAPCHYCGADPSPSPMSQHPINGIDRRDSSKGYSYENCLTCCATCNYAKGVRNYDEFVDWLRRCAVHLEIYQSPTDTGPSTHDPITEVSHG